MGFADRRNGPGNKYKDLTCNSQINSAPGTGAEDPAFRSCRGLTMRTCGGTYDNGATGTCTLGGVDVAFIGGECDGGSGSGGTGCDSSVAIDNSLITSTVTARSANTDKYNGHQYQLWDAGKIQGCKCDLGYEGADCATREVPRGDDPLTTVKATTQVQQVQITGTIVANDQFYMRFYDAYGGVWVTNTITVPGAGTIAHDTTVAALVQDQLRELPNGVLSGVTVAASTMVASTSLPTLRPPTVITGTPRAAPTSASLAAFFGPLPLPPHLTSRSPWATLPARLACSTSSKLTPPHRELVPSPCPRDLPTPLPPPSPRSTTTTTSATFLSSPTAPTVVSTMAKASASALTATVASPAKSRKPSSKRAVAPCTCAVLVHLK